MGAEVARAPEQPPGGIAGELFYRAAYLALWCFFSIAFKVWFRLRVTNRPRLEGPYVLVANHTSFLDPFLVGAALHRRCVFMMTEVFYRDPRSRWFYRLARAIPVAIRGGNRDAMRAARASLGRGEIITVFPEGGISRDGLLFLGNPGAVALVLSERVPIVPAAIVGAHEAAPIHRSIPRPGRIEVRFGEPIAPEQLDFEGVARKRRLALATEAIMTAIAELGGQQAREPVVRALRSQKAAKA